METLANRTQKLQISKKTKTTLVNIIAYIFIVLFLYTATNKFFTMGTFVQFMNSLAILKIAGTFLAWAVPIIEVIISILLIIPAYRHIGTMSSGILMTGFTAYLIYLKLTQPNLPCSCGGVIENLSWTQHIWFNIILVIMSAIAVSLHLKTKRNT